MMKRNTSRMLIILCAILVSAAVVVLMVKPWRPEALALPPVNSLEDPGPVVAMPESPLPVITAPTATPPAVEPAAEPVQPQSAQANVETNELVARGLAASAGGRHIQARTLLSEAFFAGGLSPEQEAKIVPEMERLFNETILSPRIFDGDEYVEQCIPMPGQTLAGSRGIVESKCLYVPANFIVMVNRMGSGQNMQAGKSIKLVKGPFVARVYKSRLAMDLYLQPEGRPPLFARRLPVGLGKDGATPSGRWRLIAGGKTERKPWTPTAGSNLPPAPIPWGHPDYALGFKGMWIGLAGLDADNQHITDFGIHSTSDQDSIGGETSLGCVRMKDADIELVFNMLYDGRGVFSVVEVVD